MQRMSYFTLNTKNRESAKKYQQSWLRNKRLQLECLKSLDALNRLVGRESMCQGLNAKNKRFLPLYSLNRELVQNTKSLGDMKQEVSSVKVP